MPETADELGATAQTLGASADDVFLGARASKTKLIALSKSGELRRYAIVDFATHGALTGEVKGSAEPGLILTPPAADAGATAAGARMTALSRRRTLRPFPSMRTPLFLRRAIPLVIRKALRRRCPVWLAHSFYAGARSLLISHGEVNSHATVGLMTNFARSGVGRAEALRRAMVTMIVKGKSEETHPSIWAPFELVGEGAQ